jgi:CubicO group peptidase (beta-lactamase class C family)
MRRSAIAVFVIAALTAVPATAVHGQAVAVAPAAQPAIVHAGPGSVPVPVFTDENRREKLAKAFPEIDRIVTSAAERSRRPGSVLGVVVDGELVHVVSAGVQDLQSKAPVTADSVFRIASMTKSFTAMAILSLRDAGKLSLDDPVDRHVPELAKLAYPTSDSPRITIRHLLSHSEGFPEDNPWGDRQLARSDAWMDAAMRAGIPFSTVPGTEFEYSNFGFAILGRIVQNVSRMPYERYVERTIFTPLGMTSTTFDVSRVDKARLTPGYRLVHGKHEAEDLLPHGSFGAMGGLWTSTRDLAKYVAFLMSAFPPRDGPDTGPIRRASAREMQTVARHHRGAVRRPALDAPVQLSSGGYAYGLSVSDDCTLGSFVGHGGGLPGYGSLMRWSPDRGVGLVAMANLTYSGWGGVFNEVFAALQKTGGLDPRRLPPSPALLETKSAVTDLILRWDDAAAERFAADNLFMDESKARRRERIAALLERHGTCREAEGIDAENALRGSWKMPCDRGWLNVSFTLAPTMPPKVQSLNVQGVMPPAPQLQAMIDVVLALMSTWDADRARTIVDPKVDLEQVSRHMQLARLQVGTCRQGETLVGDGTRALFKLDCDRGTLQADVVLDTTTGRVTLVRLMPDFSKSCVP